MSRAPILIAREGVVSFGDASVSVWEEGISAARAAGGHKAVDAWEAKFKREVFARIVQTLRRLGWTVTMPAIDPHTVKHYGGNVARWSAERKRFCTKGDLKGDLQVSGRHIEFKMFQSVNCPTRADHEGRYEWDKEACMPYVVRLEMQRTRNRIRDYLCNVFSGYSFDPKHRTIHERPGARTAMERINAHYAESSHYKGTDWAAYLAKNHDLIYNRKSKDGVMLDHGQRVWFADRKGRICEGTALYNINNMWWIVTGKYDYTNEACFHLYTRPPENIRVRRNERQRRVRIEGLIADATKRMDYEKAAKLRDVLFPPSEALHLIQCKNDDLYWKPDSCGYTKDATVAGRYTSAEAARIVGGSKELRSVLVREAA